MNISNRGQLIDMDMSHLELVLKWRNQEFIREVMYHDELIKLEDHQNWFNKIQKDKTNIVKIFYFDNKPYGVINISNIDKKNNKGEWGFYIGEKLSPIGLGKVMGFIALNYIFNELRIRKLCAEIIDFNKKSMNFHERLGFGMEGILKKHVLKENRYVDVVLMSLFHENWDNMKYDVLKQIEGMKL